MCTCVCICLCVSDFVGECLQLLFHGAVWFICRCSINTSPRAPIRTGAVLTKKQFTCCQKLDAVGNGFGVISLKSSRCSALERKGNIRIQHWLSCWCFCSMFVEVSTAVPLLSFVNDNLGVRNWYHISPWWCSLKINVIRTWSTGCYLVPLRWLNKMLFFCSQTCSNNTPSCLIVIGGDLLWCLCLPWQTLMEFRHPDGRVVSVALPARSLLVMRGESRYLWTHGWVHCKAAIFTGKI